MQSKPWRRLWHLLGGSFFPIMALFIPRLALLITLAVFTAILVSWEMIRFASPSVNRWMTLHLRIILKKEEATGATGSTYLLIACLIVFLFFEKYIAIASLFFLAIGDLMAAIIGDRFGRHRVFKKSLEGSFACLIVCILIGIGLTRLGSGLTLPVVVAGAVSATIAELLPIPINDNLVIPLLSAGIMTLAALYIG